MSIYFSEEQRLREKIISPELKRLMDLLDKVNTLAVFEYEGRMYFGNAADACKEFCDSTSYPSDFHVWLQKNYKQV